MATSIYVVCGICANFWGESGVNPGIYENLDPLKPDPAGYGLGQWTNIPGGLQRRTQLWNWLAANGYPRDSGLGQLNFLIAESYWSTHYSYAAQYANLTDYLNSASFNLDELTWAFGQGWEGIWNSGVQARSQYAHDIYQWLIDHMNDPRQPWHAGNYYLTAQERYENILHIYDFFTGYIPPTPPTPEDPIEEWQMAVIRKIKLKRERSRKDDISKRKSTYIL